jgi:hypothetical protein
VKVVLLVAKIIPLLAGAFCLLMLGLLFHKTSLDIGPLASRLAELIQAATDELDVAHSVTMHVDEGVNYEVKSLERPTPMIFKILRAVAGGLGAAAKL